MFGPPQPGASTYALSRVDSSSTLAPRAAAQNVASSRASRQSNVTLLMKVTTQPSSQALRRLRAFIRRRRSAPSLPQNSHDQHRTMSARERRGRDRATMKASEVQRALAAAMSIASSLDLTVDDTIVLHDSNKLTLRLLPCDVLARVALVAHEVAQLEIELARRLTETGCPVAALEHRVEPRVYERSGFAVTLWTYYEPSTS